MSYEPVLLPKFSPDGTILLAKEQVHNSYTFWAMPFLIFSPVQIIISHPLSKLIWRFCQILGPSQNIWTLYKPILHWTRGPNFIDLVKVEKTSSSIEELGRLEDVLYWQKLGCQQHLRSLFRELQHLLLPSSRTKLCIPSTLNISLFHF